MFKVQKISSRFMEGERGRKMTAGEYLKRRRKLIGKTLEQVSKETGVTAGTLSRYENGEIKGMSAANVIPIARALCCNPLQILYRVYNDSNIYEDEFSGVNIDN